MAVHLNHTIVSSRDPQGAAAFLAGILGLPAPTTFFHFEVVQVDNGVSLDFTLADEFTPQHYAFLISDAEFDEIHARVRERDLTIYADPSASHPGEINHDWGGRGFYFASPDGHWLEVLTRPYGSAG